MDYSINDVPYGFVRDKGKWGVEMLVKAATASTAFPGTNQWTASGLKMTLPIGSWNVKHKISCQLHSTVSGSRIGFVDLQGTTNFVPGNAVYNNPFAAQVPYVPSGTDAIGTMSAEYPVKLTASEVFYVVASITASTGAETFVIGFSNSSSYVKAENAYL